MKMIRKVILPSCVVGLLIFGLFCSIYLYVLNSYCFASVGSVDDLNVTYNSSRILIEKDDICAFKQKVEPESSLTKKMQDDKNIEYEVNCGKQRSVVCFTKNNERYCVCVNVDDGLIKRVSLDKSTIS